MILIKKRNPVRFCPGSPIWFLRANLAVFIFAALIFHPFLGVCQNSAVSGDTFFTLRQCITYALDHQPALNISRLNLKISRATNAVNLSGWYPQAGITASQVHYLQLPSTLVADPHKPGSYVGENTGVVNSLVPGLAITQAIFSPTLLLAAKSASLFNRQAELITDSTKINVVASVSKTFYNLLLTYEQIDILREDTVRLAKNLRDSYHQYVGGIVDETDYEQATITLNNSKAQLKQATENLFPQYASLKQLMGYPVDQDFRVRFDTAELISGIAFDTTRQLEFEKRVEFKQLKTTQELQKQQLNFYKYSFAPTVSAFYNYNHEWESNSLATLYDNAYPSSLFGVSLSIPVFTGMARWNSVKKAKLQVETLRWSEYDLKEQINSQYAMALANYKSNLYDLYTLQENVTLAKKVYFVVNLQYKQGLVPYLNVITAESNLITSEIGYMNALFLVLSNKIDLEKAMGEIAY